jgi:hypothetical protein
VGNGTRAAPVATRNEAWSTYTFTVAAAETGMVPSDNMTIKIRAIKIRLFIILPFFCEKQLIKRQRIYRLLPSPLLSQKSLKYKNQPTLWPVSLFTPQDALLFRIFERPDLRPVSSHPQKNVQDPR